MIFTLSAHALKQLSNRNQALERSRGGVGYQLQHFLCCISYSQIQENRSRNSRHCGSVSTSVSSRRSWTRRPEALAWANVSSRTRSVLQGILSNKDGCGARRPINQ